MVVKLFWHLTYLEQGIICYSRPCSNSAAGARRCRQCAAHQFGEKEPWEPINWGFADLPGLRCEYHTSNISVKLKIPLTPTVSVAEATEIQALTEKQ